MGYNINALNGVNFLPNQVGETDSITAASAANGWTYSVPSYYTDAAGTGFDTLSNTGTFTGADTAVISARQNIINWQYDNADGSTFGSIYGQVIGWNSAGQYLVDAYSFFVQVGSKTVGTLLPNEFFVFSATDVSPAANALPLTFNAVPEPGTGVLVVAALAIVVAARLLRGIGFGAARIA